MEKTGDNDTSALPSLAIECIYEHYIEVGVRSQGTPWKAQVWLARQRPLRGSAEFCSAARRKDRLMTRSVAGMRVYPWPGIECTPNPPGASSLTLVMGLYGTTDKAACMRALAQECSIAPADQYAIDYPAEIDDIPEWLYELNQNQLCCLLARTTSRLDRNVMAAYEGALSYSSPGMFTDSVETLVELGRVVRLATNVHIILTMSLPSDAIDRRLSSVADRISVTMGRAIERTHLAERIGCMLGADPKALATLFISLPDDTQVILERRPGCARDEPLHRTNTLVLIRPFYQAA